MLDNSRPDRGDYPTAKPSEYHDGDNLIVSVGDYVVNRDGDIVIATTCNKGEYPNDFIRSLNEGYFRAKFIGRPGDYLEYANQSRAATPEEIKLAQQWQPDAQATTGGQVMLF